MLESLQPEWRPSGDAAASLHRRFTPQEVLYRQGERRCGVFALRRGVVKLVRQLADGRARIVGLHGPGATIGCVRGVDAIPHSAIAVTTTECRTYTDASLRYLREHDPEACLRLMELLQRALQQQQYWLCELSMGPVRKRLARLFRFLDALDRDLPAGEIRLLTCQEMGEALAVTPETVSRAVAAMKRARLLMPVGHGSSPARYRCDLPQLRRLARPGR